MKRILSVAAVVAVFVLSVLGTRMAGETVIAAQADPAVRPSSAPISSSTPTSPSNATPAPAATAAAPAPASPSPTLTPKPVSAEAILAALQQEPLAHTPGLAGMPVTGPEEYITPGDSVPSARQLGGVEHMIDTGPQNAVFVAILMFEGPQDAETEVAQELTAAEAGGEGGESLAVDGTEVHCSQDGVACIAQVGRAYIRVAGGADIDVPYVLPGMRAAIATLATARAKAADA